MLTSLLILGLLQAPVRIEAEDATLSGSATVAKEGKGFSGSGYVTNLTSQDAKLSWKLEAKAGVYKVRVGFRTPGGKKGFQVLANGGSVDSMFPDSPDFSVKYAGKIELRDGENTVGIGRGWGHYDVDYIELEPAGAPAPLKKVPATLATSKASKEAKQAMAFLAENYGSKMLSGQYNHDEDGWLNETVGRRAAILAGDFMDYSPSRRAFGADPGLATEQMVAKGKAGQLISMSWHWNAPKDLVNTKTTDAAGRTVDRSWYRGFYSDATTFDLAKAIADPTSEGYKLILRDIDAIAVELKKFADAKVPVLWRPLHEAEGGWFWWGARGSQPCIALWKLLFQRLTNVHKLNNLIWVWNSADAAWYPGDDTVDIVSIDAYPGDRSDPLSAGWEDLSTRFDGKKLLGLAEFPGAPDVDRMFRFGVRWSFFISWTGDLGPKKTDREMLKRTYDSPNTITLDELGKRFKRG